MSTPRVALVTGSNKGIGLAVVRALCQQFAGDVYLTARDVGRGTDAVRSLKSEGLNPLFHQLDITNPDSRRSVRDFLQEKYGGLDVLINNAAIAFKVVDPTPFAVQAEVTLNTNFFATRDLCNELLPIIKPRGPQIMGDLLLEAIRALYGYCKDMLGKDLLLSSSHGGNQLASIIKENKNASEIIKTVNMLINSLSSDYLWDYMTRCFEACLSPKEEELKEEEEEQDQETMELTREAEPDGEVAVVVPLPPLRSEDSGLGLSTSPSEQFRSSRSSSSGAGGGVCPEKDDVWRKGGSVQNMARCVQDILAVFIGR
ncbi:CBR1 reductase, partial [Amia calva]|nr:CBR1 reductase [Amia calva]